ncbi:MAG: biotin--[acetyl-CoA-carboxylase] ligase [Firmicutes bacterium]|nr:biotin--[acetyl-CoA-carboxylase] ligase [Dethiobacter sp.]MBS3887878.1 biotin--[acetyl-CoA-carboxylase] ligase [Bacillota bacterium]MBS4053711.1 biotin--[acetyl-CoA-carboxylase] ligase [Thermaerobacter sp.]
MHPTTDHILRLLLAEACFSGEDMARELGLSRAAIWKHISELRSLGFSIKAVPGQGYVLQDCPDTLHQALVHAHFTPSSIGRQIIYLAECDSTNARLKHLADEAPVQLRGLTMATDRQSAGRGRRGRTWQAGPGEGLLFSVLLYPPLPPNLLHGLTLMAGVAVVEALAQLGVTTTLKWPNDVYLAGRKLCGILAETSAELDHTNYVVLGIGLNVSGHPPLLETLSTDLYSAGIRPKRAEILARILCALEENYTLFLAARVEEIYDKWRLHSHTLGRKVTVHTLQGELCGVARDITSEGALLITLDSGEDKVVTAGDVTVRY